MATEKKFQITQRLYTLAQAAQYLGRSVYSMRGLIWAGRIPVLQHRPRGKQYVDVRDLDHFIETEKRTIP